MTAARIAKKDEFYTNIADICKEMQNYNFNGMIVYCNCDNPQESAFWEYFHKNFSRLGLKKLLSTYFGNPSFLTVYAGGDDNDVSCGVKTLLHENGDFRSEECLNLLEASDIVASNPPLSLFRRYLSVLFQYGKRFIILGNLNEAVCKDVFPHFRGNELWFGKSIHSGDRKFYVPDRNFLAPQAHGFNRGLDAEAV